MIDQGQLFHRQWGIPNGELRFPSMVSFDSELTGKGSDHDAE